MLTLTSLIIFSCLTGQTFGQTCAQKDFISFNNCLKTSFSNLFQSQTTVSSVIKDKVLECFNGNNCTCEEFDPYKYHFLQPVITDKTIEEKVDVLVEVADHVSNDVDVCVSKNYPEYHQGFVSLHLSNIKGVLLNQQHTAEIYQVMEAINECDDAETDKYRLFQCVQNVSESLVKANFRQFCNETIGCVRKLPCNDTALRAAVCACTRKVMNTTDGSANRYQDEFYIKLGQPPPSNRVRQYLLGPFVRALVDKICFSQPCNADGSLRLGAGGDW